MAGPNSSLKKLRVIFEVLMRLGKKMMLEVMVALKVEITIGLNKSQGGAMVQLGNQIMAVKKEQ